MNKVTSIIPVSIFVILAGLFISGGVYATQASTDTEVDLELATVINITTPETSNINCVSLNTLCTSTATVTVGTNNSTGYTLQLNATSGYSNSLTNAATSETIPTLSGAYAAGSFPTNYWGYTGGLDKSSETGGYNCSTNYCPILAYQSNESNYAPNHVIKTSNAPASEYTTVTFGAKADVTKPSGTYSTSVTFTAVTNYVDPCLNREAELYCKIATMSKGTQTIDQFQAAITVPTSADRTQDTSNSGVYEYDSSVFGISSDASNNNKIYYYRGVLENSPGTYGSDGSAVTYPNYVNLGNTCWRIIRTTGSGGVKMIYNGPYGATISGSCANTETNTQVATQAFALKGNSSNSYWYQNVNRIGYTFNNDSSIQDNTTSTSVDIVFGSDSNPGLNNARSNIKTYIEDTWYANNMTNYTSILEASAGYCNDCTVYTDSAGVNSMSSIPPYASNKATAHFGSKTRVIRNTSKPTLNCPRGTVDLYRYVANSQGLSNELKYPTALITADEAAFAGSGNTGNGHENSYLFSGSSSWLLSPLDRANYGTASGYIFHTVQGRLLSARIDQSYGVRPVISLIPEIIATSGTGTATDPWIVSP